MQNALRERWLREAEQAAAEALTLEDLADAAMPKLARALDAPIQLLVRALPNSPAPSGTRDLFGMHPLAVAVTPSEMYNRFVDGGFFREFPHASPTLRSRYRGRLLVASEVIPHVAFQRTRFYNEFFRSFDAEYQAALCIEGKWWQPGMLVLALVRCTGQRDFSAAEVRAIERIAPALHAAASRAARNEQLIGDRDLLERIASKRTRAARAGRRAREIAWVDSGRSAGAGGPRRGLQQPRDRAPPWRRGGHDPVAADRHLPEARGRHAIAGGAARAAIVIGGLQPAVVQRRRGVPTAG